MTYTCPSRAALAMLGVLAFALPPAVTAQQTSSDEADRVRESILVLNEIMQVDDQAIPEAILSRAEAVAVFPSTIRGGFIVGGLRGRGILSVRQDDGWSPPAFFTLTGGSIGLQIGAQASDIVLVILNRRGLDSLLRNQFRLGTDASVAAGPVGREAQAATDATFRAEILGYSRARGLFAGVTVNGSTIRVDEDANARFYGTRLSAVQVTLEGAAGTPDPVPAWQEALARHARREGQR
jgi:lipid-binding SYLF domain-containing protein